MNKFLVVFCSVERERGKNWEEEKEEEENVVTSVWMHFNMVELEHAFIAHSQTGDKH